MSGITILQIAHDHPDWVAGGSEIVARDLARALDARRGSSAALLVAATALHRPEAAPGSLGVLGQDFVLRTGAYDRFSMLRQDGTEWIGGLSRVLDRLRPDVVHLHGLDRIGAEVVPLLRRLVPRCRIVLTLHDYQLICANDGLMLTVPEGARCGGASPDACRRCFPAQAAARHALRRAALLAMLDGVDVFVAPSRFLRDRFVAWGLAAERIRVIPNAVTAAPKAVAAAAVPAAGRARRDRFAFFGNIAAHKGVLTLLEAAARLKAAGETLRLSLHGGLGWSDAAFRADFATALAAAAPLAHHAGAYGRDDVAGLMAAADWVVLPSLWWENAPLVIEEARAAGRPLIVSGIGGMAEAVRDGRDGLHVPPGDAAALADAMVAASDPALWSELAGRVPPADFAAFVEAHAALYAGLLARVPA